MQRDRDREPCVRLDRIQETEGLGAPLGFQCANPHEPALRSPVGPLLQASCQCSAIELSSQVGTQWRRGISPSARLVAGPASKRSFALPAHDVEAIASPSPASPRLGTLSHMGEGRGEGLRHPIKHAAHAEWVSRNDSSRMIIGRSLDAKPKERISVSAPYRHIDRVTNLNNVRSH